MVRLAWANLLHSKVRTTLSVLAVAIAVALLLVLVGLSSGTLNEVSRRMQSVDAEIIVRDRHFDLASFSGGKLWEKEISLLQAIRLDSAPVVERVMPVFLGRVKLAGLSQNVFGVHPSDFTHFAGSRKLIAGSLFHDVDSSATLLTQPIGPIHPTDSADLVNPAGSADIINLAGSADPTNPINPVETIDPADGNGSGLSSLPLVIDQRLARAAGLGVGDVAQYGDITLQITGIVETGVAGRVFAPINLLRASNGVAAATAHMFFVKAVADLGTDQLQQLCERIELATKRRATLVANYGQVLAANFRHLTIFVSLVSVIALVICFLFILVTVYTIVLERSREIAILQSLGAGNNLILLQTVQEVLIICTAGAVLGFILAFVVRWIIQTAQPLMTVEISLFWLLTASGLALLGGVLSSFYPGYLAIKRDPVETLSFE